MAFIKFSSEYIMDNSTAVENIFIAEYMPRAADYCTKVYLYGLYMCGNSAGNDNDIEDMARMLNLATADILSAYTYWQELGLVQILRAAPPEVRYLPIRHAHAYKKYKPSKFADFNVKIQEILSGRMLSPNEYNEYYNVIESMRFEPEAILLIAKYCVNLKGADINYPYIIAVARNWAADGVVTVARVEERLMQYDGISADMGKVMKALKSRKAPDIDDRQLYIKWTKNMGFDLAAVLYAAESAASSKGGIARLDQKLTRYYESKLQTKVEIETFEKNRDGLYGLARKINRTIGVYYDQLDYIVETYINAWIMKGYDEQSLLLIADACFKRGIKTLDGMNGLVQKLYEKGLVTVESIISHLNMLSATGVQIKAILDALGIDKAVTSRDRDAYRTWTYSWGFPDEVILAAAALSKTAVSPLIYLNKVLSDWHARGIKTAEQASKAAPAAAHLPAVTSDNVGIRFSATRVYSAEELNSLIDNIDDIEL